MKKAFAVIHWLLTVGLVMWCFSIMVLREQDDRAFDYSGWRADRAYEKVERLETICEARSAYCDADARQLEAMREGIGEVFKAIDRNQDLTAVRLGQIAEGVLELQGIMEVHRAAILELNEARIAEILEGAREREQQPE